MAADAVALLDALGVERGHVVGASMGGMIAQTVAIEHPERTATLTSIMSTTGEREYGQSTPEAQAALTGPRPADRAAYIESAARTLVYLSKRYGTVEWARSYAAECYDRAYRPEGMVRQMAAIMAGGSRADGLRALTVPTLVIHGLDDTLIAPSGGERTAELVPGAQLLLVPDMGHDRPEPLWPVLAEAIVAHTA
jgi:pimeloyl-ACP methyl ester carboxylesterase